MKELAIEIVEDMISLHKDLYPFDLKEDDYDDMFEMIQEQIMDNPQETIEQLEKEIEDLELEGDCFKEEIEFAKSIIAKINIGRRH